MNEQTLSANVSAKANLIWAIADKLTGVYKPHEYGEAILPLTVIRRFDAVLADTKQAVIAKNKEIPFFILIITLSYLYKGNESSFISVNPSF